MAGNVRYNLGTMRNLPSWSIGDGNSTVSAKDFEDLMDTIPDRSEYTMIVTGYYSEIYPGKENEDIISVSFIVNTDTMVDASQDDNLDNGTDIVNSFLDDFSHGYWEDVLKIYLVDR